jgi:hypothetical protein
VGDLNVVPTISLRNVRETGDRLTVGLSQLIGRALNQEEDPNQYPDTSDDHIRIRQGNTSHSIPETTKEPTLRCLHESRNRKSETDEQDGCCDSCDTCEQLKEPGHGFAASISSQSKVSAIDDARRAPDELTTNRHPHPAMAPAWKRHEPETVQGDA